MEEKGIDRQLRTRIKELYEETRCKIIVNKKFIGKFRTKKGVRKGCPLSAVLFNILFEDLEEEL